MDYPGVTTPMLYIGSLFSTFFWHVEDHWMHSINYSHYGATKTWYGVPSSHAEAFERVVFEKVYRRAVRHKQKSLNDSNLVQKCALKQLLAKNTLFLPKLLLEAGIPVYRLDQEPGDFILTLPRGYHAGFSHGFNVGEAVNFALPEWLPAGAASLERYCWLGIPQILPHQLILVKEAAAVIDRLQREQRCLNGVESIIARQFCAFAVHHADLRSQILREKGLQEVATENPLRSQICFMCYRHVCGVFVIHSETGASRCLQCSIRASHIVDPEWKLARPAVASMIEFLEHQFRTHHGVSVPNHPLDWTVPRKRRSMTQRPAENDLHEADSKRRRLEEDVEWVESGMVKLPNGVFRRTLVQDTAERYLIAMEFLVAIGAPVQRPEDVDRCLEGLLVGDLIPLDAAPPLIQRCFRGERFTLIDQRQAEHIMKTVAEPSIRQSMLSFVNDVWPHAT